MHARHAFPIPRNELPVVVVSPREHQARKAQVERILENLLEEYAHYAGEAGQRDAYLRRWKPLTSKGRLKLFRELDDASNAQIAFSSDEVTAMATAACKTKIKASASRACSPRKRAGSEFTAEQMMPLCLMTGEVAGRVENALYASITRNQQDLALVDVFLHDDVADCAVLHELEGPSAEAPFHQLAYKWFVKKSPTSSRFVRHRDSVYIEFTGLTRTKPTTTTVSSSPGETVGFQILQSVDIKFADFRSRNCIRSAQSIRTIYRQRAGDIVDVFSLCNIQLAGSILAPIASKLVTDTLLSMPRLVECGEVKRLTEMWVAAHHPQQQQQQVGGAVGLRRSTARRDSPSECCALCRQGRKFGVRMLIECGVCGAATCSRCRLTQRVFVSESSSVLGHFQKLPCCRTCVRRARSPQTSVVVAVDSTNYPVVKKEDGAGGQSSEDYMLVSDPPSLCHTLEAARGLPAGKTGSPPRTAFGSYFYSMGRASSPAISGSHGYPSQSRWQEHPRQRALSSGPNRSTYTEMTTDLNITTTSVAAATGVSPAPTATSLTTATTSGSSTIGSTELMTRMLELQTKVEDAYLTVRENEVYLQDNGSERPV